MSPASGGPAPDRATLAAFADGALAPEQAARVEAHLAAAPADRAHVERLIEMRALLAAAYEGPLHAPLPDRLRAALAAAAGRGGAARRAGRLRRWWRPTGAMAIAAALALVIGVAIGQRAPAPAPPGLVAGPVSVGSALHALLEEAPSGRTAALPGAGEATLVASFLDGAGRPCRELEIAEPTGPSLTRAVACREDAAWAIPFAVAEPAAPPAAPEAFVPASGAGDAALGVALDALGAGMVLGPDEEAALIAGRWR